MLLVKKGIIFLDIAIAQMAVLGSMIAEHIFEGVDDGNVYLVKTFSVCFSMLGSCFFYILNKKFNNFKSFESIIGITYVFMATIFSLLLSIFHASFDSIEQIFAGKLLFLTYKELLQIGIIYLILACHTFCGCCNIEGFVGANTNYGQSSPFSLTKNSVPNTSSWGNGSLVVTPGKPLSKSVKSIIFHQNIKFRRT